MFLHMLKARQKKIGDDFELDIHKPVSDRFKIREAARHWHKNLPKPTTSITELYARVRY